MAGGVRTCLILTRSDADTLGVVRALHRADLAVLERYVNAATLALACSGEFQLVALVCEGAADVELLGALAARTPILALWEHPTVPQLAASLMAGADACLKLDADDSLIIAQAHAVLRRHVPKRDAEELGTIRVGDITVDLDRCEVERAGEIVSLTPSEFRIIEYLARNAGRVSSAHVILNACSEDYEYRPAEARDVLKVYVRRIRQKLEQSETEPKYLITVRGFGYRLASHEVNRQLTSVG